MNRPEMKAGRPLADGLREGRTMSESSPAPVYMATVLPGLEPIAGSEVAAKIDDANIVETTRGKILFTTRKPADRLMSLRTIDNLYLYIGRFSLGPHKIHLADLEKTMARIDLSAALDAGLFRRKNVSFVVNASRSGKHTYSRFDMSEAAVRGILRQCPQWRAGTADDHELEFRLDLSGEQALFSLRLTPAEFRFRGSRTFSQAALRPPVAHALVWICGIRDDDCFVDPFCGSGTIVAERAAYPAGRLLGGDISAEAVAAAKRNVPELPGVEIHRWDATDLPLEYGSVDALATNLPFGQQILTPEEIAGLYYRFMKELKRVLAADGRAVLLTDRDEELRRAADKMNVRCEALQQLSLKGLHPWIYRVTV